MDEQARGITREKLWRVLLIFLVIVASIVGFWINHTIQLAREEVEMNVGINIGNALEAPKNEPWDVTMQMSYFDVIKEAGFDTVRIPIRFSDYLEEDGVTLEESFLAEIDAYITYALNKELVVIIDLHHFTELMEAPNQYDETYYAIWEQLSTRYQDYPKELLFELLNEPQGKLDASKWNDMVAQSVALIREKNPTRKIIVDTSFYANVSTIEQLELPKDRNLIVSFHYYEPNEVAFQGNQYHPGFEHLSNIHWIGNNAEMAHLENQFQKVADYAKEYKVDIFLGEFGTTKEAPLDTRINWTREVANLARKHGFAYAYWELASGFGIYNSETGEWNKELLDVLLEERMQ